MNLTSFNFQNICEFDKGCTPVGELNCFTTSFSVISDKLSNLCTVTFNVWYV